MTGVLEGKKDNRANSKFPSPNIFKCHSFVTFSALILWLFHCLPSRISEKHITGEAPWYCWPSKKRERLTLKKQNMICGRERLGYFIPAIKRSRQSRSMKTNWCQPSSLTRYTTTAAPASYTDWTIAVIPFVSKSFDHESCLYTGYCRAGHGKCVFTAGPGATR